MKLRRNALYPLSVKEGGVPSIVELNVRMAPVHPARSQLFAAKLRRLVSPSRLSRSLNPLKAVSSVGRASQGGVWSHARSAYVKAPSVSGRRVIVKARLVNLSGRGRSGVSHASWNGGAGGKGKIAAHMRYLSRDGVSEKGNRGIFYDGEQKGLLSQGFVETTAQDHRQFRFIVSPEDAHAVDLTQFTRDLVHQMQQDLGTKLEWIAVNHYNTDNPHVHLSVRGVDELGKDLFIHPDYIKQGLRYRASELMSRELGPITPYEQQQTLSKEITASRYTSLDRTLESRMSSTREINFSQDNMLTPNVHRQRALLKRLGWLNRQGLADRLQPGRWRLNEDLRRSLNDSQKYQRTLDVFNRIDPEGRQGHVIHRSEPGQRLYGKVIHRGLSDELYDKHYVVVDAMDGNLHYVDLSKAKEVEKARLGNIVSLDSTVSVLEKKADRTIQRQAEMNFGVYDSLKHTELAIFNEVVSAGAVPDYIQSHRRRMDTLVRYGFAESLGGDRFRVPGDLVETIRARDHIATLASLDGHFNVRIESFVGLKQQTRAIAATWLDKRLLSASATHPLDVDKPAFQGGFANDYREAIVTRQEILVEEGLGHNNKGVFIPKGNMLNTLRRMEYQALQRSYEQLGHDVARLEKPGDGFQGVLIEEEVTAGGRYAIVQGRGQKIAITPWQRIYARHLNQKVALLVEGPKRGLPSRTTIRPIEGRDRELSLGLSR